MDLSLSGLNVSCLALVQTLHDGDPVVLGPVRIVEVAALCMPQSQQIGPS